MYSRFARLGAVLLAVVAVSACSTTTPHAFLPEQARGAIASSDVVVPIRQNEIYVYVPPTTAGAGFGLIGALVDVSVDSVRASKAETAVKPLRDALVDYSFDTAVQSDMAASLSQIAWLGAGKPHILK